MEPVTDDRPAEAGEPFAELAQQAAAVESGAEPGAPAVVPIDNTPEELLGALTLCRLMLAPGFAWWPAFGEVWNDAALKGISEGGAAVMERHGWTMGGMLSEWGPYLALIAATAPPALATYQAMHERKEARQRERSQPAKD